MIPCTCKARACRKVLVGYGEQEEKCQKNLRLNVIWARACKKKKDSIRKLRRAAKEISEELARACRKVKLKGFGQQLRELRTAYASM